MPTSELSRIFREKQYRPGERKEDAYWGCVTEPTDDEILDAIRAGNFNSWSSPKDSPGPHVQGNRPWHIGRIAWFVMHWEDGHPIKVNADRTDLDGGHRVFAALIRGITELEIEPSLS